MAQVIDSLWSPTIRPTILSPFAILDLQARALTQQTNGILVGDVKVAHDEDKKTTYLHLDLIVPALNYRQRALTAEHAADMIYPVRIDAAYFRRGLFRPIAALPAIFEGRKLETDAASDEEFRHLVEKVLKSDEVTSLALSLIARANDVLQAREREAQKQALPPPNGPPGNSPDHETT